MLKGDVGSLVETAFGSEVSVVGKGFDVVDGCVENDVWVDNDVCVENKV